MHTREAASSILATPTELPERQFVVDGAEGTFPYAPHWISSSMDRAQPSGSAMQVQVLPDPT